MTSDEARRLAQSLGLTKLSGSDLDLLAQGTRSNIATTALLPKNLHWTEEPAHVFRLPLTKGAGK